MPVVTAGSENSGSIDLYNEDHGNGMNARKNKMPIGNIPDFS